MHKSTKILIKINRLCPDSWAWSYKVCTSRRKNAAVSESLTRVKFLGHSQGEINFRAWQGSIELHCIISPRQKENREKCRTRASLINIITSDSDGAHSKVIQESIVENFPAHRKVTISGNWAAAAVTRTPLLLRRLETGLISTESASRCQALFCCS